MDRVGDDWFALHPEKQRIFARSGTVPDWISRDGSGWPGEFAHTIHHCAPVGAHRGTALHPIRQTINSWDPWASGDSIGGRSARTANRLSIRVRATRFSRGTLGEKRSQVDCSLAQRERGSCAPFIR